LIICMVVVRCLGGGFGLSDTHICNCLPARLPHRTHEQLFGMSFILLATIALWTVSFEK